MAEISIIGGGAWGTALGSTLASEGAEVLLFAREGEVVDSINTGHINKVFLDGIKLSPTLKATNKIEDTITSEIIFLTTPSQFFRRQLAEFAKHKISPETIFVICSKGVEDESLSLMSEVFETQLSNRYAILSGPTFAAEVAQGSSTSASLATSSKELAARLKRVIDRENFTTHINNDITGSQVCGAIKNVIAIGCGLIRGLGGGENARAAILSRGFREIMELNKKLGGQPETLMEPCGIGDLILTCSSEKSRNFSFGMKLASGVSAEEILRVSKAVVEGVDTSKSLHNLTAKLNLNLPLCQTIHQIIEGKAKPDEILTLV